MRSTAGSVTVRLYHVDEAGYGGAVTTLMYGTLDAALAMARAEPEEIQAGLFIATDNDVIAYLDLAGG